MRVLIVGYGSMGRRHAATARALGHELGICETGSVHADSAVAAYWTDDVTAALRRTWDAVVIATPAATHAALLWQVPRATPVFIEKPLALSVPDYWQGHAGWAAGPDFKDLAVGYQMRFHPHVRALRGWIDLQPTPRAAVFWCQADATTWPGQHYADALLECSHELDLAQHCFGPLCFMAAAQEGDAWRLLLRAGETSVTVFLSMDASSYERWAAVLQPDGYAAAWWGWDAPRDTSILDLPNRPRETRSGIAEGIYQAELAAFLDGRWTAENGCTLGDALQVLNVCDRARRHAPSPD